MSPPTIEQARQFLLIAAREYVSREGAGETWERLLIDAAEQLAEAKRTAAKSTGAEQWRRAHGI